jgi:Protein of unknown function (DUF3602)
VGSRGNNLSPIKGAGILQLRPPSTHNQEMPDQKYSHGRGGVGNISKDTITYVDGLSYSPPVLTADRNPHYTTGRGGAGNIRKYDPVAVRLAQDVPSGPTPHIPQYTAAGRGGIGNLQAMQKRRRESAPKESTVASNKVTESSTSKVGLANWSKEKLFASRVHTGAST